MLSWLVAAEVALVALHGLNGATFDGTLLSLDQEQNLPTWFASMQLAVAAVLAALAARPPRRLLWAPLAALLALLSLDEIAMIHEAAEAAGDAGLLVRVVEPLLAVIVAAALLRGGRQLPRSSRLLLLAAGVTLAGALGASASASLADGTRTVVVAFSLLEESLEMLFGTLVLVAALPDAMRAVAGFVLRQADEPS